MSEVPPLRLEFIVLLGFNHVNESNTAYADMRSGVCGCADMHPMAIYISWPPVDGPWTTLRTE